MFTKILAFALFALNAQADVRLPAIDAKYVQLKEINPTRNAGYVVGDILERTVIITVQKPYELVTESLPIVGYEHRWKGQTSGIELVKISAETEQSRASATHTVHLSYQVFTTSKLVKLAALRAEVVKIRNTQDPKEMWQYQIPSFTFRISPLSVFGSVKLKEDMHPFAPPFLFNASSEKWQLKLFISLAVLGALGLLYIYGVNTWLPKMGGAFAKAYRQVRKAAPNAEGVQSALQTIHTALNKTAGQAVFSHTVADLIKTKPQFAAVESELTTFFTLSKQTFFDNTLNVNLNAEPHAWLKQFCRHLRDCERGLTPEVKA